MDFISHHGFVMHFGKLCNNIIIWQLKVDVVMDCAEGFDDEKDFRMLWDS